MPIKKANAIFNIIFDWETDALDQKTNVDRNGNRKMVSNTLMHREFTSGYTAKFVIEEDRMYVGNANRVSKEGFITVDNLEPNLKNPIIAAFFRNIGYADQLGQEYVNYLSIVNFILVKNRSS